MPRITSLEECAGCFWLRFGGDDFDDVLAAFKQAIPNEDRIWHEDDRLWQVQATISNETRLSALLPSFAAELRVVRSQMSLL